MNLFPNRFLSITVFILFFIVTNSFGQSEKQKINDLIKQKREYNKNNKNSIVYKIQLYNGGETEALKIKKSFEREFPEYKTILYYKAPEWKAQVGTFKTRLEADRALLIISKKFDGAIVFQDKV